MSDVFISYARSTEVAAQRIADALRELGCEVWRDDELPVHVLGKGRGQHLGQTSLHHRALVVNRDEDGKPQFPSIVGGIA